MCSVACQHTNQGRYSETFVSVVLLLTVVVLTLGAVRFCMTASCPCWACLHYELNRHYSHRRRQGWSRSLHNSTGSRSQQCSLMHHALSHSKVPTYATLRCSSNRGLSGGTHENWAIAVRCTRRVLRVRRTVDTHAPHRPESYCSAAACRPPSFK